TCCVAALDARDGPAGLRGDALLLALGVALRAHAGGLARRRVEEHHVGGVDRGLEGDDPPLGVDRGGLAVALAEVDPLDHHAVRLAVHADDAPLLAALVAAQDADDVALADVALRHQITSGASETIFMKRFSRSSRPTGPKMRVARG